MKTKFMAFILVLCLFEFGTIAFAQNYRCGGKLIRKGMTKVDLIKNCGEPDRIMTIVSSNRGVIVKQQVLLYDGGAKKYAVTIASGSIFRINEYADYKLRCKGRTINVGDSEEFVLENCGAPWDMQQILFGDLGSHEKGERFLYRKEAGFAIVVTKEDEVLWVVIHKAGNR